MAGNRFGLRAMAGLLVHLLTASGAAIALLALFAAIGRDFSAMFAWLGVAIVIDGVDGPLARAARVSETAPTFDGAILDLVVDFLTYVLTPVVALWRSDLMAPPVALWIGLIVTVASALYFADTRMKTADNWFRGFPALWNVFALYLFVFRPPGAVCAALLLIGAAMMFAPVVFVHPLRVRRLRPVTLAVTLAWSLCALGAVVEHLNPGVLVKAGLILTGLYILALPLLRPSFWADA